MSIYLDTCSLNRLNDDLTQPRVRDESKAMQSIMDLIQAHRFPWVISDYLRVELEDCPDPVKRAQTLALLQLASMHRPTHADIEFRAEALERLGFGALDALHLAFCEHYRIQYLITTDDRFLRRAARLGQMSIPLVLNPIDFLQRGSYGYRDPARPDDR